MKILKYYIAVLFLLSGGIAKAQIPDPPAPEKPASTVSIVAKSFGDSIVLRFAPTTIEGWKFGNAYGYNIYRYLIVEDEENVIENPQSTLITKTPLKPLSVEEIERLYITDTYAGVVAQAIYGSTFNINSEDKNTNLVNLANEMANRYSFALFSCDVSVNAARSHGLIYIDKDIKYGNKYLYYVKPVKPDTFCLNDSAAIFIAVNDTFRTPVPANVYAAFEDKSVVVSWEGEAMEQVFSAYNIERSDDGGKTFHKINDLPVVNISAYEDKKLRRMMYSDSIPFNEKEYFYRVTGITPFGEISKPSEVVSGLGKTMLIGVNPIMLAPEVTKEFKLKLNWEFPEKHEKDIKGFIIEKSDDADGIFSQISDTLGINIRTFTDKNAENVNYYQVCAISKSDYTYCSFPSLAQIADSIPPAVPIGLKGIIDSLGIVNINWTHNNEKDLMSYKVYRSNFSEGDFVQVNTEMLFDTEFTDTIPLNNLSKNIFYAVTAQDKNYNESGMCTPVKILKPDTIPPVAPVIRKYEISDKGIKIHFTLSSSEDVKTNLLYRKENNENDWKLIEINENDILSGLIIDSTVTGGNIYNYMMEAVDESGLKSINNNIITIKTNYRAIDPSIPLKISSGENGRSVVINWNYDDKNIRKILIYKSSGAEDMILFRTLNPEDKKYIDTEVKIGSQYNYRCQTILVNGTRSKISEAYSINL